MITKLSTRSNAVSRIGTRRQVVIPKRVFDELKLQEGDFVEVTVERGNLRLRPKRLVNIDNDVLTPAEAVKVRRGVAEIKAKNTKPWRTVKHELAR